MSSPSANLAVLYQIKANYLANIAALSAIPKPNYALDGQSVQWLEYQMALLERGLTNVNRQIQIEGGPLEQITIAIPTGGNGGCGGVGPNGGY